MNTHSQSKPRKNKGSRKARLSAARMAAVQAVYQMDANDQTASSVIEEYISFRLGKSMEGHDMVLPDGVLFRDIVSGIDSRRNDLHHIVSSALKNQSRYKDLKEDDDACERLEPLLLSILLCGAYELLAHHDIDAPIIISDYLNVTHAFYEQGEDKLVNGLLDAVRKAVRD